MQVTLETATEAVRFSHPASKIRRPSSFVLVVDSKKKRKLSLQSDIIPIWR